MVDYNSFKDLATEMIAEYGFSAMLCKVERGGNALDPTRNEIEVPVRIVEMDKETTVPFRSDGGEVVPYEVRKFYMSIPPLADSGEETELVRGPWGAPEVMTEQTIASGDEYDFVPTGDNGVQATNIGIFAWYTEGDTLTLLWSKGNSSQTEMSIRTNNQWGIFTSVPISYYISDANRVRFPLPSPRFILMHHFVSQHIPQNIQQDRNGILIDDATGQSLYYCNNQVNGCEHYRRAITDSQPIKKQYAPAEKDLLVLPDGRKLAINKVAATAPGNTPLFYEIETEA